MLDSISALDWKLLKYRGHKSREEAVGRTTDINEKFLLSGQSYKHQITLIPFKSLICAGPPEPPFCIFTAFILIYSLVRKKLPLYLKKGGKNNGFYSDNQKDKQTHAMH